MFDLYTPTTRKLLNMLFVSGTTLVDDTCRYVYSPDKFTYAKVKMIGGKTVPSGSTYSSIKVNALNVTGTNLNTIVDFRLNSAPNSSGAWVTNNGKVGLVTDIPLSKAESVIFSAENAGPGVYAIIIVRLNATSAYSRQTHALPWTYTPTVGDRCCRVALYRLDNESMTIQEARNINFTVRVNKQGGYVQDYKARNTIAPSMYLSGINDIYNKVELQDDLKWTCTTKINSTNASTLNWYKYSSHVGGDCVWGVRLNNVKENTINIMFQYPLGNIWATGDACCEVRGNVLAVWDPDFVHDEDLANFKAQLGLLYYELETPSTADRTAEMYGLDYYEPSDTIVKVSNTTLTYDWHESTTFTTGYPEPKEGLFKGSMYSDGSCYVEGVADTYAIFSHYFPAGTSTLTFSKAINLPRVNQDRRPSQISVTGISTYTFTLKHPSTIIFNLYNASGLTDLTITVNQPYAYMLESDYRNIKAETLNWSVKASAGSQGNTNAVYGFEMPSGTVGSGTDFSLTGMTTSPVIGSLATQLEQFGPDADNIFYKLEILKLRAFSSQTSLARFKEFVTGKIFHYKAKTRAHVEDVTWNVEKFNNIYCEPNSTINFANTYNVDVPVSVEFTKNTAVDFNVDSMAWYAREWWGSGGACANPTYSACTDYIDCVAFASVTGKTGTVYFNTGSLTGLPYYSRAVVFFDGKRNFISRAFNDSRAQAWSTTIPSGARYLKLQIAKSATAGDIMTEDVLKQYNITWAMDCVDDPEP